MQNFNKIVVFGALLQFSGFSQGHLWGTVFAQQAAQKTSTPNKGWRPGADPAFHEIMIITVPLGLTGFQLVVFWMKMCSISVFSCFSRCLCLFTSLSLFSKRHV